MEESAPLATNSSPTSPSKPSVISKIKETAASVVGVSRDLDLGILGILHPTVLQNFEIGYPCSALELNLEPFKKEIASVWADE
jgi:phenylalanyl-tRNA synthetase beta chain